MSSETDHWVQLVLECEDRNQDVQNESLPIFHNSVSSSPIENGPKEEEIVIGDHDLSSSKTSPTCSSCSRSVLGSPSYLSSSSEIETSRPCSSCDRSVVGSPFKRVHLADEENDEPTPKRAKKTNDGDNKENEIPSPVIIVNLISPVITSPELIDLSSLECEILNSFDVVIWSSSIKKKNRVKKIDRKKIDPSVIRRINFDE